MLKRFSNITLLVLCGLLVVGIIVTRRIDTAIETNENRKEALRKAALDFNTECSDISKLLIATDTSSWLRIEYTLPSFSSYYLDKKAGIWYLGETQTDSEATDFYLGKIAAAKVRCAVVHTNRDALKLPDYVLKIMTDKADTLIFETYVIDTSFIIQDKMGQLYPGKIDSLFWQLYFGKHRFIPELAEQ